MASNDLPLLSVVIEWENAQLAEAERPIRMLGSLVAQLDELTRTASRETEIVLLFNPDAVDEPAIELIIDHVRPRGRWPTRFRLLPSGDLRYYEQKNRGMSSTSGDIVVLLDSDVVPEAGWLQRLLSVFEDPAVGVVCGSTYVECASFYDRAFALFWLFPLRTESDELEPVGIFFANNVAFRRSVIADTPFPDLDTFRGQAGALSKLLKAKGVPILRHKGARVHHPPPNGLRHFVNRALCEGHDAGVRRTAARPQRFSKLARYSPGTFRERMRQATTRIARGHRTVGLSRAGASRAWSLALAYNTVYLTGQLLSRVGPTIVPLYFPIR